jgi:hypothetical protein
MRSPARFSPPPNAARSPPGTTIRPASAPQWTWPGADFTGGEFLMTEQRPRAQTRGSATTLPQGHGLVFTTRDRPVATKRGWSNGPMRHGVSTVRSGRRHTLGLVFHDAA